MPPKVGKSPAFGVPKGIRTPVTAVKGRCPRPLDDGDLELFVYGGAKRDRTADLLHAMQALSQLSYNPALLGDANFNYPEPSCQEKLPFKLPFIVNACILGRVCNSRCKKIKQPQK